MKSFKEYIKESKNPDIKKGDTILVGKWRNSPAIVKGFGKDANGQPTVKTNKKTYSLYKFRIQKLMKESVDMVEIALYLKQIKIKKYKPVNNWIWSSIKDEGYPEEVNDYNSKNYSYITLDLPKNEQIQLADLNDDIIEKWNVFDIYLKSKGYYPKYLDFIDYDNGIIYIVKHENENL
jgi:hypothetical protein